MTTRRNLILAAATLPVAYAPSIAAGGSDPVFAAIDALNAAHAKLESACDRAGVVEKAYFEGSKLKKDIGPNVGTYPEMAVTVDGRAVAIQREFAFARTVERFDEMLPGIVLNGDEAVVRRRVAEFEEMVRREEEAFGLPEAAKASYDAGDRHQEARDNFIDTVPTTQAGLRAYVDMIAGDDPALCGGLADGEVERAFATVGSALLRLPSPS